MADSIYLFLVMVFELLGFLVGLFACYKTLRHYLKLHSIEFLFILGFFWGQTYWLFVRLGADLTSIGFVISWYLFTNLIERILVQSFWGIGFVGLMLHLYRVMDWEDQSMLFQRFYQFMVVEAILEALFYAESPIYILSMGGVSYQTTEWYQQIWFFLYITRLLFAIFPDLLPLSAGDSNGFFGFMGVNLYLLVLFMLVAYTYLKVQPIQPTPEIKLSRYCWMFFGLFNCLRWLININDIYLGFIEQGLYTLDYPLQILVYALEFLSLGSIFIMLALYPNTLLITKAQLMQASELYKYLDLERQEQKKMKQFGLVNETNLLFEYVNNLPEDIKTQLSQQSTLD